MEVTAYCSCGKCNSYARDFPDFWNKHFIAGPDKGREYTGATASGKKLQAYHPGLVSFDSLKKPWMIPMRVAFFPWLLLPQKGTIAADTDYYPFGTEIYVPGYGWGSVEDRGGAIKGPTRLDIYFSFHSTCNKWGRQHVTVKIKRKQ